MAVNPSLYSWSSSLYAWCPVTSFLIPPAPHPEEHLPTSVRQNHPAEVKVSCPSVQINSCLKSLLWPTPAAETSILLGFLWVPLVPSWVLASLPGPPRRHPPFPWPLASERPNRPSLDPLFILTLLGISSGLTASESSPVLMTPQFSSPFLASPLNFRLVSPTAYSAAPLGHQIDTSSLTG